MAQQNSPQTRSNPNQATSVSTLDHESSPKNDISKSKKNEFLSAFKGGKLRKNSRNKIQMMLDFADSLVLKTQSMGIDDCWNANEPRSLDKADFWEWFENNYSDMVIFLTVRNGFLSKVEFCDCIYHFSNDLVMYFTPDEKKLKPKFTLEQVSQAIAQGFISPLNHDRKHTLYHTSSAIDDNSRRVVSLGDYKSRLELKKERLNELSNKASIESEKFYKSSKDRASHIPFGQPILVGHHSEKRARRDAERIYNDMGKSVKASKKADYYERRAESIGSAGIASDDPDAIKKLKSKLESLQSSQNRMKAINKIIRSKNLSDNEKIEYMVNKQNLSEPQANELLYPNFGPIGFADFTLQNNSAKIRNTKLRLSELEKLHNQKPFDERGEVMGMSYFLYEEDGRIKFTFDNIPDESVRRVLKSNGFKWSRVSRAWVRKMTANAVSDTNRILKSFLKL
ncbi:TPA: DUF3560 domain-containing protein [Vibrio cholerae]